MCPACYKVPEKSCYQRCPRSRASGQKSNSEDCGGDPRPCRFSACLGRRHRHFWAGGSLRSAPQALQDQELARRCDTLRSPTCPDRSNGSGRCRTENIRRPSQPARGMLGSAMPYSQTWQSLPAASQNARNHVVFVRLGNLAAIELSCSQFFIMSKVVDVNRAINLRRMIL